MLADKQTLTVYVERKEKTEKRLFLFNMYCFYVCSSVYGVSRVMCASCTCPDLPLVKIRNCSYTCKQPTILMNLNDQTFLSLISSSIHSTSDFGQEKPLLGVNPSFFKAIVFFCPRN